MHGGLRACGRDPNRAAPGAKLNGASSGTCRSSSTPEIISARDQGHGPPGRRRAAPGTGAPASVHAPRPCRRGSANINGLERPERRRPPARLRFTPNDSRSPPHRPDQRELRRVRCPFHPAIDRAVRGSARASPRPPSRVGSPPHPERYRGRGSGPRSHARPISLPAGRRAQTGQRHSSRRLRFTGQPVNRPAPSNRAAAFRTRPRSGGAAASRVPRSALRCWKLRYPAGPRDRVHGRLVGDFEPCLAAQRAREGADILDHEGEWASGSCLSPTTSRVASPDRGGRAAILASRHGGFRREGRGYRAGSACPGRDGGASVNCGP